MYINRELFFRSRGSHNRARECKYNELFDIRSDSKFIEETIRRSSRYRGYRRYNAN